MTADPVFDKSIFRILVAELGAADVAELLDVFLADTSDKIDALVANSGKSSQDQARSARDQEFGSDVWFRRIVAAGPRTRERLGHAE